MAVRLVPVLFEDSLGEWFETERADKVFGVELSKHGGDAATVYGPAAPGTGRPREHFVLVLEVLLFWFTRSGLPTSPLREIYLKVSQHHVQRC